MPTYDYRCDSNQRELEVRHSMNAEVKTWGELCELAGVDPGDTPAGAAVKRLATGGNVVGAGGRSEVPMPAGGVCCGGGACGVH